MLATPVPTHADARTARARGRQALLRREAARAVGRGRRGAPSRRPRAAGRVLMVGHLLEYHPGVRELKEMADSGELGAGPLPLLQPPEPRQAARRRERAVVARRARRLGDAAPRRRGARRGQRPRRVLHARRDRGRRLRLPALPLRAGRAPAPVVARPAQGAALHRRRLAADGDLRRHGARAQADRLRQGLRRVDQLLRRVHHPLGRHLEPAAAQRGAAARRVPALRGVHRARAARRSPTASRACASCASSRRSSSRSTRAPAACRSPRPRGRTSGRSSRPAPGPRSAGGGRWSSRSSRPGRAAPRPRGTRRGAR